MGRSSSAPGWQLRRPSPNPCWCGGHVELPQIPRRQGAGDLAPRLRGMELASVSQDSRSMPAGMLELSDLRFLGADGHVAPAHALEALGVRRWMVYQGCNSECRFHPPKCKALIQGHMQQSFAIQRLTELDMRWQEDENGNLKLGSQFRPPLHCGLLRSMTSYEDSRWRR